MKTETPGAAVAQPGNISVLQLAAAMSKKSSPAPAAETAAAPAEPTDPAREADPGAEAPEEQQTPPDLSQTENDSETPEVEPTKTEPEVQPETTEAAPETAKPGLPDELKDAIEIAKGDGKSGVAQLLKRVYTLTDARDTERNARLASDEQNAQLRKELAEAREAKTEVVTGNPVAGNPEVRQIVATISQVDRLLSWCDENPDGGPMDDGKGGTVELDAAAIRTLARNANNKRSDLVAEKHITEAEAKGKFDTEYQTAHGTAVREYPWLGNKASAEYAAMQQMLKQFPMFKASASHELDIADYLAGRALRESKMKLRQNGVTRTASPRREPAKVMTEPPGGAARQADPGEKRAKESKQQFEKTGRTADLAKSFAANSRANRGT